MLKKKRQYHYLEERRESVVSALRSFKGPGDAEHLHVVRVQIKKTIALLRLYKPLKKCNTREFRNVFKHAGLVRDSAVLLKLIQKYNAGHTALIHEQQKLLVDHSQKFTQHIDDYVVEVESFYALFSAHIQPVGRKYIVHFAKRTLDKIGDGFTQKNDDDALHRSRKRIKDLLYLHALLPSKTKDKLNLNIAYLDTLQDITGKWHDAVVAHELFSGREEFAKKRSRKLRKMIDTLARDFKHKVLLT